MKCDEKRYNKEEKMEGILIKKPMNSEYGIVDTRKE